MISALSFAAIAVIFILIIWYFEIDHAVMRILGVEHLSECQRCDRPPISQKPIVNLNPFVWPYSGASCLDGLHAVSLNDPVGVSQNTPDHSIKTGGEN